MTGSNRVLMKSSSCLYVVYTLGFPIFIKGLDYIITHLFGDGFLALLPLLRFSYTIRSFPFEWLIVNLVVRHLWYCYQFSTGLPLPFSGVRLSYQNVRPSY